MSPDQFRRAGHALIDWIADYWGRLRAGDIPVTAPVRPGDVLASLPASPPERAENWHGTPGIAADIDRIILPAITHWQHPSFFAYFPANASAPAVLGELLSAGLGVNGMLWATSPAATELEIRVLDWMAEMLGLPDAFRSTSPGGGGVIEGTASEATLVAMLAARTRARTAAPGARTQHLALYASTQAHSSVIKAAMIAGLADGPDDRRCIRLVDADDDFAMRPDLLERAIEEDLAAGRRPFFACATVGTTSSTAIDPLAAIGPIARRHGLWLHVDAAHAGAACICPEHRDLLRGAEHADSIGVNPHKWLLTNFDCGLLWTRDRASLTGALSITPEYLRTPAAASGAPAAVDFRDWQVPLGRRFRALKLWFVIRHYGVEGLRAHVREHLRIAAMLEEWIRADDRFRLAAPRTLNLVCFRLAHGAPDADDLNRRLLESVNATGRAFLSHTVLPGVGFVLRLCVGGTFTREEHVREAWRLIARTADSLRTGGTPPSSAVRSGS
jgi:aromatic-L-amino-acid decarboxylase